MIISASRRTDIPAFYSEWFFNRIQQGYLLVRNPMNIHEVSKISLLPDVVDCIVFWSKNPSKMVNRQQELRNYSYYFQFTITGYGQKLEPNVPPTNRSIKTFIELSDIIGPSRVIWRYDPIVYNEKYDYTFHINNYEKIARLLYGKTKRCVISFVDLYKNIIRNMSPINVHNFTPEFIINLSSSLNNIANKYDIELTTCAEEIDLGKIGISHGKCIDDKLIDEVFGIKLNIGKDENQRTECGCVASIDIGAYNTCPHSCLYCYANYNLNIVRRNFASHNPNSPLLYGIIDKNDKIHERKVLSCRELRGSLFDKS